MLEQLLQNQLTQLPECKRPKQVGKVDDPNYCKYHHVISHPVEKCFILKELILKLAHEKKIELDIDEVAQTNHVAIEITSSVPPSTQFYDQRKSLIQFGTFEPILFQFQKKIVTIDFQNKEAQGKDDDEGWIAIIRQNERKPNFIPKESLFHQKYAKGSISHKKKGRRNKKIWKPKPTKGKHEDFLQTRWSITLTEFLLISFLEDNLEEILEVTACNAANIPSTTRSSVFQRLSMATKEEENQCPTSTYTQTSAFKRLGISASKKDRPSTSAFDHLKMTNDQQQGKMKSLKAKSFHEENNDDEIHSHVPSRMERNLFVDVNTEGSLTAKSRLIVFTNPTNELASSSSRNFIVASSSSSSKANFIVAAERIIIFIFSHMLQPRGSSSSSSHMCCSREIYHFHLLTCVAVQRIIIFFFSHMLQPRESSSSSFHIFERISIFIFSHVLQPKGSSSSFQSRGSSFTSSHMCCSQEDHHLNL
ncbi:retrotransposon gag protein [Cucumis melo var. makuwa]|uniref:Retrotransposon gag protein n=1 Tax=Cucumis melo var. makuwa TaxID=1194695 RepID=A0A5A7U2Y2_CUCMM|nr:retrotransposon gag protein [Cucumis melo var. makuwa]